MASTEPRAKAAPGVRSSTRSAPKAPVLGGGKSATVTLDAAVFGAEVKPHLVHEAVRAELNAQRAGTHSAKSRGLVAGGRSKPWRQKGTGRARAGTIRAPQFTGGGVAFPPLPRSFEVKVNRKAARAALRSALASHAAGGTVALVETSSFEQPSTKAAIGLLAAWDKERPLVIVASDDEEAFVKSFRNLARTVVVTPAELEVTALVWARSLLITQNSLEGLQRRAS
jgi:large subunit ribosomal protein L4